MTFAAVADACNRAACAVAGSKRQDTRIHHFSPSPVRRSLDKCDRGRQWTSNRFRQNQRQPHCVHARVELLQYTRLNYQTITQARMPYHGPEPSPRSLSIFRRSRCRIEPAEQAILVRPRVNPAYLGVVTEAARGVRAFAVWIHLGIAGKNSLSHLA